MNIKTLLDIIAALGIIITVTTLVINAIYSTYSTKKINKSVDKLSKCCDDLYNYSVHNEYDKQDIYKRLAELEDKQE